MSMKIMPKLAISSLCVAAASLGFSGCSRNTEAKNVDNVLESDKIELTIQENPKKIINCNYELMSRLNEQPENIEKYTKEFGANGSSIYLQFLHDTNHKKMPSASGIIEKISTVISEDPDNIYTEEEKTQKTKILKQLQEIARQAEAQYQEAYLNNIHEELLDNGIPNKEKCNNFLNNQFAALYEDLTDDEFDEKSLEHIRDINAFRNKQGEKATQKQAEYLAYRQYKLDSIAHGRILEGVLGDLMNSSVLELYKDSHSKYTGKPTP